MVEATQNLWNLSHWTIALQSTADSLETLIG